MPSVKITRLDLPTEAVAGKSYRFQVILHVESGENVHAVFEFRNDPTSPGDLVICGTKCRPGGGRAWTWPRKSQCAQMALACYVSFARAGKYKVHARAGYYDWDKRRYVWTDKRVVEVMVRAAPPPPKPVVKIEKIELPSEAVRERECVAALHFHIAEGKDVNVVFQVENDPTSPGDAVIWGHRLAPGGKYTRKLEKWGDKCMHGYKSGKIKFLAAGTYKLTFRTGYYDATGTHWTDSRARSVVVKAPTPPPPPPPKPVVWYVIGGLAAGALVTTALLYLRRKE